MKRRGNRLLALLLCMAMVLTLLPMAAFARWEEEVSAVPADAETTEASKAELPADAPENDGDSADLTAGTILTDGVTNDSWKLDEATKQSTGDAPICEKTAQGLHLKAGTAGSNGHTSTTTDWPAVFVNETASEALFGTGSGNGAKYLEMTFSSALANEKTRFGVFLHYTDPANGFFVGYDDLGWFWEEYGGTNGTYYQSTRVQGPAANTPTTLRLEWTGTSLTKATVRAEGAEESAGTDLFPGLPREFGTTSNVSGTKLGIKCAPWESDSITEVYIKEMHYTGQATQAVYDISGKVTDVETQAAVAGVKVTATPGGKTDTTAADGTYTISGLAAGTYELSFAKSGYKYDGTKSVPVSNADVSGQNVAMTPVDTVDIPTDGVDDTWTKISAAGAGPAVVDKKLVLEAGTAAAGFKLVDGSAIAYKNETIANVFSSVEGEKTLSFTLTPESVRERGESVEEYLAFGVGINCSGTVGSGATGYFVGYSWDKYGNSGDGWFAQQWGGTHPEGSNEWGRPTGLPTPVSGKAMKFEFTWNDTDHTVTLKVDGQTIGLFDNNYINTAAGNNVMFTVGSKPTPNDHPQVQNSPRYTKLTVSNIHYTNQATIAARYVKGTVKCSGKAVEGATIRVSDDTTDAYTQTTAANGTYGVALPLSDTPYTLTASKDGYQSINQTVTVNEAADKADLEAVNFALVEMPKITGKLVDAKGKPVASASVSSDKRAAAGKAPAVSGDDGAFTIIGAVDGTHTLTITKEGYETTTVKVEVAGADVNIDEPIVLPDRVIPSHALSTEDMTVRVAKGFPQVIDYTMKKLKDANGEPLVMLGQTAELDTIKINGVAIKPTVEESTVDNDTAPTKVTYTMVIDESNNNGSGVTATITAELRVGLQDVNDKNSASAGRTLGFYITNVEYAGDTDDAKAANRLAHPVDTIEIPNHSLVSVRSTQPGAAVTGGTLAANTVTSADLTYKAADYMGNDGKREDYFAAFVYNDQLSAGLASNSAYAARGSAGDQCYPVRAQFEAKDGGATESIGLGSTLWHYDHDISRDEANGDQRLTYGDNGQQLTNAQKIIAPLETPFAKVVIAGDENGNGTVDWQDGAIAYRETVMHIPAGGEGVADAVNLRISMNFGSMAANPFLIALDNVKRVAAHTDGLGQFVLLKGYAGEGHDSNHPQYDNIGIRMGGPEDMKTLMEEGEKLGAVFGIHTNASEFYAEAISDGNQVRRNTDGSIHYGWNWLDQGIAINGVYDYAKGLQLERWNALYDIVKGHPFVVYVDVWGNNTSGTEDDFMTRALSQNIIGNNHNGWRIAHEWAWANPYESTFQHWVTDYTYGNYSDKGKLNSNVLRFILNQYKDSFPPDFATYGGAANAPLLGGPAMQGFEGWQGDGEYNLSIYNTFNQMIYTKFLQHYPVVEWTNADAAVKMPYNGDRGSRTSEADWVPETRIRLADEYDEIVVTRGTTGKLVTDFKMDTTAKFLAGETEYRSRVVTLNGKKIVEGAPASAGEDTVFPKSKSTLKYLIPWYWNAKGERLTNVNDQKLYHWNAQGGISTWELPNGWENVENVTVYALSDQGRGQGKNVKVIEGKITLTAEAETCYVVVPSGGNGNEPQIEYGTGLYLKDPSFNLDTARADCPWEIPTDAKGSAVHTTNSEGIGVLKMVGEVSVSQKFTDLVAGKNYVTYAAIDNRSDAKVTMTITDNENNVVATNYTEQSIARNYVSSYYLHNGHGMEAGSSYFQNMFLYFTPVEGKEYTLTISREAGRGNAYVDDVRTVQYGFNYSGFGAGQTPQTDKGTATIPVTYDPTTGAATALHQDFENVSQGIWPFVIGPVEGVADNRTHVSELNTPFSQAGWDVKKLDDVIDGNWSIKTNGLSGRQNLVYQTIPQNFRFEPNSVYTVEFDYELGSAGSYVAVVGDGAYTGLDGLTVINLDKTLQFQVPGNPTVAEGSTLKTNVHKANVGHAKFTVVGSTSGQTWIGIYSKDNANNQGTSGSAAAFGGYLDFVLDNLSIELAPAEKNELAQLLQTADSMVQEVYNEKTNDAWEAFVAAREAGHNKFDNEQAQDTEVKAAVDALKAAMGNLEKVSVSISGTVKNANGAPVEGVELTLEDNSYMPVGLKVTTGADGTFTFASKSGVELLPGTYHIKAQATGYNVTTTEAITVAKTAATVTDQDITLEAEAPGAYVNDFNSGDISMMGHLDPPEGTELTELSKEDWPTLEAVEYNGSGALKVTFNYTHNDGGDYDSRHINNVVDKTVQFANGTFSFDITPLTTGRRFGVTLRGTATDNRICIGQQNAPGNWMGEYWTPDNGWTANTTGKISVDAGATRNVRVVANDKTFQVFIDGDSVYNITMAEAVQRNAGYVGINQRGFYNPTATTSASLVGSEFIIDNIRIVRADAAEGVQNISGEVHGQSGAAVSGAAVELFDGDTRVAGTTTNALGEYQISRVEPGRYTMKVSAPFFVGQEKNVTVGSTDLTGQDFVLTPDRTDLNKLIAEVEALNEEDYTLETWGALAEALAAAKEIDASSSKAALETAYKNLSNAKAALVVPEREIPTDFSELRATYNELATKLNDNYTNATWTAFQEALAAAKATLLNGDATQEQVDKAKADLEAANTALVQAADPTTLDFTALQAAYDNAKNVEKGSYTDDTWETFVAARDEALAILSNADGLTQDDVDAAVSALNSAKSALSTGGGGTGGSSAPAETTKTETREDGTKVTTVTKPDGSTVETVEQPDGTKSETVTTKDGDVTITVTDENGEELVKAEIPAEIPEPETKFEDVDTTPWAEEAIHKMAGLELVNGTGGNKYSPIAPMTRGSLATVLHRLSQGKTDYEVTFKDVAEGKYYTEGVAWAAKANVVKGISEDVFAPDKVITREQLAVMLCRYAKLVGLNTKADAKALEAFTDGDTTGAWAVDSMAWCVENGILKGKGQNNLDPTADVTRAEVAVMLDRFIALLK